MAITFVGAGAYVDGTESGNDPASLSPSIHASTAEGDLTLGFFFQEDENSTWGSAPAGWSHLTGSPWKGGLTRLEVNLAVVGRVQPATPESPTLTQDQVGAGSAVSFTVTFRSSVGFDANWEDLVGTFLAENTADANVGPITGIGPVATGAAIIAIGCHGDSSASHTTLTGDSLTWAQINHVSTTLGQDASAWADYAIATGAPTITDKTFTVSSMDFSKDKGGILFSVKEPASGGSSALPLLNAYYHG